MDRQGSRLMQAFGTLVPVFAGLFSSLRPGPWALRLAGPCPLTGVFRKVSDRIARQVPMQCQPRWLRHNTAQMTVPTRRMIIDM